MKNKGCKGSNSKRILGQISNRYPGVNKIWINSYRRSFSKFLASNRVLIPRLLLNPFCLSNLSKLKFWTKYLKEITKPPLCILKMNNFNRKYKTLPRIMRIYNFGFKTMNKISTLKFLKKILR
jgi:hypothetical protein